MTQKLVIIGAGGLGREFLDVVNSINGHAIDSGMEPEFDFIGFLDDSVVSSHFDSRVKIIGKVEDISKLDTDVKFVIGVGDVVARSEISKIADRGDHVAAILVHPSAEIGEHEVILGEGTVICANASLTTNIQLGKHVHVNLNSTIGHDTFIESFVSINPGVNISGNVTIESRVLIGTGATVLQGLKIGSNSTIGAQSLATRNVPNDAIVFGVPAKTYNK